MTLFDRFPGIRYTGRPGVRPLRVRYTQYAGNTMGGPIPSNSIPYGPASVRPLRVRYTQFAGNSMGGPIPSNSIPYGPARCPAPTGAICAIHGEFDTRAGQCPAPTGAICAIRREYDTRAGQVSGPYGVERKIFGNTGAIITISSAGSSCRELRCPPRPFPGRR